MSEALAAGARRVSTAELFFGFARIGISGVGGVLPQAQHQLVDVRHWLTQQEFAEMLSLGQLMPGPNIGNVAIMVGLRHQGARGALAAIIGMMVPPFFVVMLFAAMYRAIGQEPWIRPVFHGIAAGAAGLMLATGYRLLRAQAKHPWVVVMGAAAFALIVIGKLPLIPVLLGLSPLAILCAWYWRPQG